MAIVMMPSENTPIRPIFCRFRSFRQLMMKNGVVKTSRVSFQHAGVHQSAQLTHQVSCEIEHPVDNQVGVRIPCGLQLVLD